MVKARLYTKVKIFMNMIPQGTKYKSRQGFLPDSLRLSTTPSKIKIIGLSPCSPIHDPSTPIRLVPSQSAVYSLYIPPLWLCSYHHLCCRCHPFAFSLTKSDHFSRLSSGCSLIDSFADHPDLLSIFPSYRHYRAHCLYMCYLVTESSLLYS